MRLLICSFIFFSIQLFAQNDSILQSQRDTLSNSFDVENKTTIQERKLNPLFNLPLNESSQFISQEKIKNTNYRYFGDIISLSSLSNILDYGIIGYPNTFSLYGNVFSSTSVLKDGILINERNLNYFNLNLIQTEEIDSIEILSLPRGASYSSYINPTSINIITKDFLPTEPFSKIRYYQGPDREAFINGYFTAQVLKKLFFSFSVTNRIKDVTYKNSDFSIWQGNFKLKYLLSNQLNLIFTYDINDYKCNFNGGVDYDSLLKLTSIPEDLLYDPIAAPVLFPNGKIENLTHLPRFTLKSKFFDWFKSDLNIFFIDNKSNQITSLVDYYENKVLGIHSDNKLSFNSVEIGLLLDYENIKAYSNRDLDFEIFFPIKKIFTDRNSKLFSYGSYFNLRPFSKNFLISLFYKNSKLKEDYNIDYFYSSEITSHNSHYSNNLTNSSVGIDLSLKLNDKISIYLGYSIIGKYSINSNLNYLLFESALKYSDNFFDFSVNYFINEYEDIIYKANPCFPTFYNIQRFGDLSGISTDLSFNYQFILFESKTNYIWKSKSKEFYNIPNYLSRNGIFYYNNLFSNNLDLKAGVVLNLIGSQNSFLENSNTFNSVKINSVQTIDFSVSGTIQKRATLYFNWENLLNKRYFLVPYFPMPERNIRFGVSWEFLN